MEWLGPILTGGVAAGAVTLVKEVTLWFLNRKAKLQDNKEEDAKKEQKDRDAEIDEMAKTIQALKFGLKAILHDRIKYLAEKYIENNEVSFSDRQDLLDMHKVYHDPDVLDGNGNLDDYMKQVRKLPPKV